MPQQWPSGKDSGQEATFNVERANKWTDATIPLTGTTIQLSGAGSRATPQLLSASVLYVLVSKVDMYMVAGPTLGTITASVGNQIWPGLVPVYHVPISGVSQVVAVAPVSGSNIEAWLSVAENTDRG